MVKSETRSLRGMILKPKKQTQFTLAVLAGSLGLLTLYIVAITLLVMKAINQIASTYSLPAEALAAIDNVFANAFVFLILSTILVTAGCIYTSIRVTHRFYGPMVPFMRHMARLNAGDYSQHVRLRKGDEFQELAEALNQLTDQLAGK